MSRTIRAPRGAVLSCKGWLQEAALRMLMNNLDPEVAADPEHLIVYGGAGRGGGRAARNWECYDAIVAALRALGDDETLLVQSGKPVGILRTHSDAPRVLIANSNLVPHWATQVHFDELTDLGLMMYGQMTAGSWIYIGTQGILQGTYETFREAARLRFGGSLRGRWVLTAGLGQMGGAQPRAITLNDGVGLVVEVDPQRAAQQQHNGYLDEIATDLEEAMTRVDESLARGEPRAIGLLGNAAVVFDELLSHYDRVPDIVTDQTPAHDVKSYVPTGLSVAQAAELRGRDPLAYERLSTASMAAQVRAMLAFQARGALVFDYGNNIRQRAFDAGVADAFAYQGFVPLFIRPLFCEGRGPFRWVALSGAKEDIYALDDMILREFADNPHVCDWICRVTREQVFRFQGLPARICWFGYGERARFGQLANEMVGRGELQAPIVIGRDHLDGGSVASPHRETEGMRDGSDAVADWPILNALVNAVGGATWVSFHHGGGVGIGYSLHAGQVIVADGTPAAARRLARVLTTDPATAILRHADAGYPEALAAAGRFGITLPLRTP